MKLVLVVTGHLFMIKKEINNKTGEPVKEFNKLSIQVSLNGLSFCIFDTISKTILSSENVVFPKELTPYEVLKRLKQFFNHHNIQNSHFSEVIVVHRNNLFGLVPKALFEPNELANYLKFNIKILANDHLAFDELESYDMVNIYVPFVNINNYIYDLFGEFTFKHNGTVMVESLLNGHTNSKQPVCYAYVHEKQIDITVISQKRLLLFNSFKFVTKEDFLYYLLFTLEQLKLDTESIALKLFGAIEEGDDIYDMCHRYIKHISISFPSFTHHTYANTVEETIDFTVLNAL